MLLYTSELSPQDDTEAARHNARPHKSENGKAEYDSFIFITNKLDHGHNRKTKPNSWDRTHITKRKNPRRIANTSHTHSKRPQHGDIKLSIPPVNCLTHRLSITTHTCKQQHNLRRDQIFPTNTAANPPSSTSG